MHLVVISGAARPRAKSNTAKIIAAFQKGYEEGGNTTEVWYLSDHSQWAGAAQAFERSDNLLIALPLYVENIPGILLEFLSGLKPKSASGTKLAFLLQGGFPEASQSRCCEAYLETLPAQLGCEYAGTLLKGDLFGLSLTDEKSRKKCWRPLRRWGGITQRRDILTSLLWTNSPLRSICPRARFECTTWSSSIFPGSLWAVSPKSWAARKNWTHSLTGTAASNTKGTPPAFAVCPHFVGFGKNSREKSTIYI